MLFLRDSHWVLGGRTRVLNTAGSWVHSWKWFRVILLQSSYSDPTEYH